MDSEDGDNWQWHRGESGFHIHIPPHERLPTAPSPVIQGRYASWESEIGHPWVPDLSGCSLEDIVAEAARIHKGDLFTSIEEFDRCLHSWCVLNGRRATKIKTQRRYAIRVCQFGGRVRPLWRHNADAGQQPTHGDGGAASLESIREDGHNFSQGLSHEDIAEPVLQTVPSPCTIPFAEPTIQPSYGEENVDPENCSVNVLAPPPNPLSSSETIHNSRRTPGRPIPTSRDSNTCTPFANDLGVRCHSRPSRQPLQQIHLNAQVFDGHNLTSQTSQIRNTRDWIPSTTESVTGEGRRRNVSTTGACGELGRVVPPHSSSPAGLCPWRVRVQLDKSGKYQITICTLRHTCPVTAHKWRGPTHQALWLGQTLANRVVRNVKVAVKELTDGLQMDYMKTTNYQPMWRARDRVKDWYLGGQRQSFHMIPALMARLQEVDPDCVVDWSTHEDTTIFKRAFICPSATRGFLRYCQPLLSLDACHTKNRKYPCQLFLATVLDGNMRGAILCYGVAPVESTENWLWFNEMIQQSINGMEDTDIPLISDRQKGLIAAVQQVFPEHFHGNCAHHLRGNVKKHFGKAAESFFWGAVYAHTPAQFNGILDSLETSTSMGRGAIQYIKNIDPKTYARHAFPLPRLGKVTSNPVEQANSGLLAIREFAPFQLLVELWYYMQDRFNERRREASAREEVLTSPAHRSHAANLSTFGQWTIHDDGQTRAMVQTPDRRNAYIVDVADKAKCTCYELQEMIWPCQHIMAWDDRDGKDFMHHFHACWLTSSLVSMYEGTMPVFLCNDLEASDLCFPPEAAVKRGCHRVVRMRAGQRGTANRALGPDEFQDALGNLFLQYPVEDDPRLAEPVPTIQILGRASEHRPGVPAVRSRRRTTRATGDRRVRCSNCGGAGHNRRTCVNESGQSAVENQQTEVSLGDDGATDDAVENHETEVTLGDDGATDNAVENHETEVTLGDDGAIDDVVENHQTEVTLGDDGATDEGTFQQSSFGHSAEEVPPSPLTGGVPQYPPSDPDSEPEMEIRSPVHTMEGQNLEPTPLHWMSQEEIDYYINLCSQSIAQVQSGPVV